MILELDLMELELDKTATRKAGEEILKHYKLLKKTLPDYVYETDITSKPMTDIPITRSNQHYSKVEANVLDRATYITKRIKFVERIDNAIELLDQDEKEIIKLIFHSNKKLSISELEEKTNYCKSKIHNLKTAAFISLATILGEEVYIENDFKEEVMPHKLKKMKATITCDGEFIGEKAF